jgi:hypothetical protein
MSVFMTSLELTLSKILDERKPRHRLAPLGNPKEKCSLQLSFALGGFFLKKERTFFFGVLPSKYSGSVAGRNAIRTKQSYFCGRNARR